MKYDFYDIEKKWIKKWEEKGCFHAKNDFKNKKKFFSLIEFPYPSGQGLHVGHPRSYVALDIISRKRRMLGYNVLYPIGWDAFGLPAENFAIKNNVHPEKITKENIGNFKKQLKSLGISFDWSREINTTDPSYFKWTQWIFLKLFEHNLAYKKNTRVNWCPNCKCVLANEEAAGGVCERCSSKVVNKNKSQWMLKITKYAKRLIEDLDTVNYPERVKLQQKNWIGYSKGAEIEFVTNQNEKIKVYTTKPETLFGVTFLVLSPEHPIFNKIKIKNEKEVKKYQKEASEKLDFQRKDEKTGMILEDFFAIHPITKEKVPVFVADYVLASYGTGSIMAVPGHDERDEEFSKKFNLEIKKVIDEEDNMINSSFLDGLDTKDAKEKIIEYITKNSLGREKENFKLRDWVFSRQRYWGEPIPIVVCDECGYVPISENELPLKLPKIDSYKPTDTGESPLSKAEDFVNTICPKCHKKAKRETDTMPQWAGSSWYFLRYTDPHNNKELASKEALNYWMNVDWYNGGMEHTTLHLLYSRFWHKFLYDIGVVSKNEPYNKRTSHGIILGENFEKMSKSKGNVVNPDDIVKTYGADTLRLYEMFIGDFEKAVSWQEGGVTGCKSFLSRYSRLDEMLINENHIRKELECLFHKTIKKVTLDIENLKFNTAISSLMSLLNEIYALSSVTLEEFKIFTLLLSVFAPFITEEMWEKYKFSNKLLAEETWPSFDEEKCKEEDIEIAIQVNGKVKSKFMISILTDEEKIISLAKSLDKIQREIKNKTIIKEVYVKGRLVNIVTK